MAKTTFPHIGTFAAFLIVCVVSLFPPAVAFGDDLRGIELSKRLFCENPKISPPAPQLSPDSVQSMFPLLVVAVTDDSPSNAVSVVRPADDGLSAAASSLPVRGKDDQWRWRRAGLSEYVTIPIAAAGTLYFENKNGKPSKAHWTAHNGVDEQFRDWLRLRSLDARDTARLAGDVLMGLLIAAPVVDSFATLGMRDSKWDALWQTSMINLESYTFTSLVSSVSQSIIARQKPYVRNCADINHCEEAQPNRSMPSGHTAFAFTGAGLLCTHHHYQHLYGDPSADRAACITGLGLATATGVVRMMADGHYVTDVAAGTAIGLFSGFVLPRLLHYSWLQYPTQAKEDDSLLSRTTFVPQVVDGGGMLNCSIRF